MIAHDEGGQYPHSRADLDPASQECPRVRVPNRLREAILSVVSNALKFSDEGAHIDVRLTAVNDQVAITVTDHGQGIDADDLPYVFDRFSQMDARSTRHTAG
jgi:signal transduction histidine kinase